jgi:hypothetical protein
MRKVLLCHPERLLVTLNDFFVTLNDLLVTLNEVKGLGL